MGFLSVDGHHDNHHGLSGWAACLFYNSTSNTTTYYPSSSASSAVTDFIISTGTSSAPAYTLIRSNNQSYYFSRTTSAQTPSGSLVFYLTKIVDEHGNTTAMTWSWMAPYGGSPGGWVLSKVSAPGVTPLASQLQVPYLALTYGYEPVGSQGGSQQICLVEAATELNPRAIQESAAYVYTSRRHYPNPAITTTYRTFACLETVEYNTSSIQPWATATYAYNFNEILVSDADVFPELTSASDVHADGPQAVTFAYQDNSNSLCGMVKTISGPSGHVWEEVDPSPSSSNAAGVIFCSVANPSITTEYKFLLDGEGQIISVTDLDSTKSVSQTYTTQYSVDPSTGNVTTTNTDANSHVTATVRQRTGQVLSLAYPKTQGETTAPWSIGLTRRQTTSLT